MACMWPTFRSCQRGGHLIDCRPSWTRNCLVAVGGRPRYAAGAAAASVASGAAASVALAAAWGKIIPGYGRPGGGVRDLRPFYTLGASSGTGARWLRTELYRHDADDALLQRCASLASLSDNSDLASLRSSPFVRDV